MYRDELAAFRERYDTTRRDAVSSWAGVEEQLELLRELRRQLKERDLSAPQLPEVVAIDALPELDPDQSALELTRLSDTAERETTRLRSVHNDLSRLADLLNRRLRGEDVTLPLGDPPRPVPWVYAIAEVGPAWLLIALSICIAVAAIVFTESGPDGAQFVLAIGGLPLLISAIRTALRVAFLRRCRQAVSVNVVESGSDGSTMTNWPVRKSKGWDVSVEGYTGSGSRDVVQFLTNDGRTGKLVLKSAGYTGGVVLYDPQTLKAFDVKQLACGVRPDMQGRWTDKISRKLWMRIALTLVILAVWSVMLVSAVLRLPLFG